MFGNLTDKFFCLLLGVFAVFVLVLKNAEGDVTERYMNYKRTPVVQKVMRQNCNGQVVDVALPADYAAALQRKEQNAQIAVKGDEELKQMAGRVLSAYEEAVDGPVEKYNENSYHDDPVKNARKIAGRKENYNGNRQQTMAEKFNSTRMRENFENAGTPNPPFHTVPGQLQANLAPRQFLGATQASKAVMDNLPDNKHLTGKTPINERYSPNFNNVIEPVENYRENQQEIDDGAPAESPEQAPQQAPQESGLVSDAAFYDRIVFKIAQSRRAGQGDMIRGDLPIQPCDQVSRTSADPVADLQVGAMNQLFGSAADNVGVTSAQDMVNNLSGTGVSGVQVQGNA